LLPAEPRRRDLVCASTALSLFVQSRGALRRELCAHLRTGHVTRRPRDAHLASWAECVPASVNQRPRRTPPQPVRAPNGCAAPLTECVKAVVRNKGTYLSARHHRIKSRRGHAKATVATAHKILTAAYHVLNQGAAYHELGEEFFYRRDTENIERYRRRLIRQLKRLGHQVTLGAAPQPGLTNPSSSVFDSA
jgi:hypothetical protein